MEAAVSRKAAPRLDLPPVFDFAHEASRGDAFDLACGLAAAGRGAGTLVWPRHADRLDVAVVLEPDEPLGQARRAVYVGMSALADALGSVAPPEKPVAIRWPDEIRYDGARLGGGRLGWPERCADTAVPDWLVFSATLQVRASEPDDPGATPDSTALEEEGFEPEDHVLLVEAFARHLMLAFARWRDDGFAAVAELYRVRLEGAPSPRLELTDRGDARENGASGRIHSLRRALETPGWRDPATGLPRA